MAKIYSPRINAPSETNKYYIKTTYNGYNRCIIINYVSGSVLPNCTGYAWGRFCECQDVHDCNLSRAQAEAWYLNTSDGYARGQEPKLGAVICWSDSSGDGHVAIVEKIYSNGDILTSNSAYNGSRFYLKTLKASNNYYYGSTYHFQGFIYNPTEFEDPDRPPQEETKRTKFPWVLYAKKFRNRHLT